MLLLPTICLSLSAISGAGGIALSTKSVVDTLNASVTNRFVQEKNEQMLLRFDAVSQKTETAMNDLGITRMRVTKNFSVFVNAFEKIHNRPSFKDFEHWELPAFNFEEIKNVTVVADLILGSASGAIAGTVLGAAAASGTKSAMIALGTASTGTKIVNLAGAAQTKAALAALGGGAKAIGGGGIALGTTVLGAATLGVGVLVEGIALAYAGSKSKKAADESKKAVIDNERLINEAIKMQVSLTSASEELKRASTVICNHIYKDLVMSLKKLVETNADYLTYTYEERTLVENNMRVVQLLNYLNNIPLYRVTLTNEKGEPDGIEYNAAEIDEALNKVNSTIERSLNHE